MPTYLVDTSVWIDFFKNHQTPAVEKFYQLLDSKQNYGITQLIYQEVTQGALNEKDFTNLADYLISQTFFHPTQHSESYKQAACLYFTCRRKGITIRSTIDCLIAQIAIEHDLILLHNDNDFVQLAKVFPQLKLWQSIH
jgi:predicted nucleic acid-binding protein